MSNVTKFEMGKQYVSSAYPTSDNVYNVIFVGKFHVILSPAKDGEDIVTTPETRWWIEYVSPKVTQVVYFNIYDFENTFRMKYAHSTRAQADMQADAFLRKACIRVEFVEGQFDE